MVGNGRVIKKRITLNLLENINRKKYSAENLKSKLQTYSLKLQSSEPLWKLAIRLFLRVRKDKKIAVRNSLCLVNYYLKLLTKKFLVISPQYCEDTWKCLNELWTIVENSIKYTKLMKGNSMAIEQVTAHLIDLNVLTLEKSPGSDCFDIYNRLSFLHEQKRDTDLDVLLHCKTLVVPQWRIIGQYIVVLRKILEKYSKEIYDYNTFLKLCLLARIVLIMAKDNYECKDLLLGFCQKLQIPGSSDYEKLVGENKFPSSNKNLKIFIKNIDVVSVFKSLYSPKKVNLMDEAFDISERQESLKCNKKVITLKNKYCEEQKDKSNNEPRDLFPTVYDSLCGAQLNGKNIENVDPLDKFRPHASNETEGKKSAKQLIKTKNLESEITSKVSKANFQKVKNNKANLVQTLMNMNNPRDLFSVPKIITKNNKIVKELGMMESNVHSDSLNRKKNLRKDSVCSFDEEKDQDCNSELLRMNQLLKRTLKLENVNASVDKLKSISKKRKVSICGTSQPNLAISNGLDKTQVTEKKLLNSEIILEAEAKLMVGIRKRKRSSKKNCAVSNSSRSELEDNVNATSTVSNFKEKQDFEAIKEKILAKKRKLLEITSLAKLKSKAAKNKSIKVQKIEDKNIKMKKPRTKKLKSTKANADQKAKLDDDKEDLRLADEGKQSISSRDNDFWTILTDENKEKVIKSRSKNRHIRRSKKFLSKELRPEVTEVENNSVPIAIDGPTNENIDSDVEIIEESQSHNLSMSDSATESEESEIDEASGSEDEIVSNDETCSMFTEEESSVFEKNFREKRRKSKEPNLESKIVEILEKRRQKETKTHAPIILKSEPCKSGVSECNKPKKTHSTNSKLAKSDDCSFKRDKVGHSKDISNVSSGIVDLVNDSDNSNADDELKIIPAKSKNVDCHNNSNNSKHFDLYTDGLEIIHEPEQIQSQTVASENNASCAVSKVAESMKSSVLSKQKINELALPFTTYYLGGNTLTKSDHNMILQAEEDEISKPSLNLRTEVAPICDEKSFYSEPANIGSQLSVSIVDDICQHTSGITGSPPKNKVSPVKVIERSMLCDLNTEDSVSSTSDVGDEAYEAGCSDNSSDDSKGKKFGNCFKSKQKRLSSEELSSLLQKRRRQSSSASLQNDPNHSPKIAQDLCFDAISISEACNSSNLTEVASPLNESRSLHLEIEVSSDDTSVDNDIKYISSTEKSNSLCTDDKSHHEINNENDALAKSYESGDISDVSVIVIPSPSIANLAVDLVHGADRSKKTERLVNLNENSKNFNISNNNINLDTDDTNTINEHEKFAEDKVPVTELPKNVSNESISPLKVIDTGSDHYNGKKSPMSAAVLGNAIESIMAATSYTLSENVISDSAISKIEDNKDDIKNNEQEGEELEVLSTSSLETEEGGLHSNLVTLASGEKRNSATKSLFTIGKRRKSVQEIKSPCKRNLLTINSPHFPSPQKVLTSALMGSELIISPGVSDDENEIGKEINSHAKIIESLPSVDQPDPWIRSKSPQKITQEEQTDIIDKSSLSEILIKKPSIKLVSKNISNHLVNEVGTAKSSVKYLNRSPVKSTACPQILSVANPLPTLEVKSPVLTTPSKKLFSTIANLNSKSPSPKSPVNVDKFFSERNKVDFYSPSFLHSTTRGSSRLSLSKTRKSLRTAANNIDSISPVKNECASDFNSEIPDKAAIPGVEECITENIINSPSKTDKDGTMVPNVLSIEAESSVICKVKSSSVSPIKSSVSPKGTKQAIGNEKLEDSVPSDSEDRDKVFSPIKRSTRSSTIARRLTITSATISELDLNSPRRTRRSSISSVTTQDELLSSKKLLESPVRARTRRNSAANTLTPIRRSRRISGIIDEFPEMKK